MVTKDGGPAFPSSVADIHNIASTSVDFGLAGMSLRDYFAAKAMAADMAARLSECASDRDIVIDRIASNSYRMADAMLKAREA